MKKSIISLFAIAIIASCQSNETNETPTDLEGKKTLLTEKKKTLRALESEIKVLTDEISQLDPSLVEKPRLVSTTILSSQNFESYIDIQGMVFSDEQVNVVSEVPGRIVHLTVKEGDQVSKGQLIAKLDLETINKQKVEIETTLQLATDVYERQARLWDQQIGSEIQYLEARNTKERLEKSLETLDYQLTKANIYAPISGVVDMEFLKSGELAAPGSPIIRILDVTQLKVEADLPENYLRIARIGLPVQLYFPSIDREMQGAVSLLGRSIDPANRTLKIEIRLKGNTRDLKPNLLAEIKLKEMSVKDVVVIPVEFILQEVDGSEFVYTVNNDQGKTRAKKTYVKSGEAYEGNIMIDEGLRPGVEIITKGARNVSDGELIQIINNNITSND